MKRTCCILLALILVAGASFGQANTRILAANYKSSLYGDYPNGWTAFSKSVTVPPGYNVLFVTVEATNVGDLFISCIVGGVGCNPGGHAFKSNAPNSATTQFTFCKKLSRPGVYKATVKFLNANTPLQLENVGVFVSAAAMPTNACSSL